MPSILAGEPINLNNWWCGRGDKPLAALLYSIYCDEY